MKNNGLFECSFDDAQAGQDARPSGFAVIVGFRQKNPSMMNHITGGFFLDLHQLQRNAGVPAYGITA